MSKKNLFSGKKKSRRVAAALAVCFLSTIALTGAYTWMNSERRMENEVEEEITEQANTLAKEPEEYTQSTEEIEEVDEVEIEEEDEEEVEEDVVEEETEESSSERIIFHETDQLLWPVDGSVKMSYSMDKTVYFETLDQYKYNPALIISAAVNDNVISAASGVVKSIDIYPQTGTTITIDMGNGYECLYGQLKDVMVRTGEEVSVGQVLGYVSEPTMYYSLEGSNLYFEMRKDASPINPMDYLAEE